MGEAAAEVRKPAQFKPPKEFMENGTNGTCVGTNIILKSLRGLFIACTFHELFEDSLV